MIYGRFVNIAFCNHSPDDGPSITNAASTHLYGVV